MPWVRFSTFSCKSVFVIDCSTFLVMDWSLHCLFPPVSQSGLWTLSLRRSLEKCLKEAEVALESLLDFSEWISPSEKRGWSQPIPWNILLLSQGLAANSRLDYPIPTGQSYICTLHSKQFCQIFCCPVRIYKCQWFKICWVGTPLVALRYLKLHITTYWFLTLKGLMLCLANQVKRSFHCMNLNLLKYKGFFLYLTGGERCSVCKQCYPLLLS